MRAFLFEFVVPIGFQFALGDDRPKPIQVRLGPLVRQAIITFFDVNDGHTGRGGATETETEGDRIFGIRLPCSFDSTVFSRIGKDFRLGHIDLVCPLGRISRAKEGAVLQAAVGPGARLRNHRAGRGGGYSLTCFGASVGNHRAGWSGGWSRAGFGTTVGTGNLPQCQRDNR